MKIGLTYDLKQSVSTGHDSPDDAFEEYDSPETVEAIAAVIETQGHSVVRLGGGREFLTNILSANVDFVFNIAEGIGNYRSREAQVPSVLEMLNIPYSGADPQCLAICLDKPLTKKLIAMSGVTTPTWRLITDAKQIMDVTWNDFPFPVFIKPAYEGSSKGILQGCISESVQQMADTVQSLLERYSQPVIVEEFIDGDEITVGVVGNSPPRVIGIMRVLPRERDENFIYSLKVKRDWQRLVEYESPPNVGENVLQRITDSSLKAFEVLGCRDVSRIDFRLSPDGTPYFLEINPLPGLNPTSGDLPILAGKMGWAYTTLVSCILNAAMERYPQCVPR
jgi:D-alanine-D-alanine ligase